MIPSLLLEFSCLSSCNNEIIDLVSNQFNVPNVLLKLIDFDSKNYCRILFDEMNEKLFLDDVNLTKVVNSKCNWDSKKFSLFDDTGFDRRKYQ